MRRGTTDQKRREKDDSKLIMQRSKTGFKPRGAQTQVRKQNPDNRARAELTARAPTYVPIGYRSPPPQVLDTIAKAIGIPTQQEIVTTTAFRDYNPADWWLATVSSDYATVIHNKANPHLETNSFPDGRAGQAFDIEVYIGIYRMTGVVVHLPTATVVRRSLPPAPIVGANSLNDVSRTDTMLTSHGIAVPSVAALWSTADELTLHPRYEGPVVYIWKHNGVPRFSTRRKLDAKNSKWARSRQFSEIWAALNGPPIASFFPDDAGPDGEGICYAFVLAHPDLTTVSRIDIGEGYLVYLGAVCSETGNILSADDSRIKWTGIYQVLDSKILPTLDELKEDLGNAFFFTHDGRSNEEVEAEISMESERLANQAAAYHPFPPPSETRFKQPEKGNANQCADDALSGKFQENGVWLSSCDASEEIETDAPSMYLIPHFDWAEAETHLSRGFDPKGSPFGKGSNCFADYAMGEPVIVRARFQAGTEHEYVLCYTLQPEIYTWCSSVVGNSDSVEQRALALERMASVHRTGITSGDQPGSANQAPGFDRTPFLTGRAVQIMLNEAATNQADDLLPYHYLFMEPPDFVKGMTTSAGLSVLGRLRDEIAKNEGSLFTIPHDMATELHQAYLDAKDEVPREQMGSSQDPYYLWALLQLTFSLAPHRKMEAMQLLIDHAQDKTPFSRAVAKLREIQRATPSAKIQTADIYSRLGSAALPTGGGRKTALSEDNMSELIKAVEDNESEFLPAPKSLATVRAAEALLAAL